MKSEKDEQDRLRDLDVLKTGPSWPRLIPSLTVEKGFYSLSHSHNSMMSRCRKASSAQIDIKIFGLISMCFTSLPWIFVKTISLKGMQLL